MLRKILNILERNNPPGADNKSVTLCCNAPIEVLKVGDEVFARCSDCKAYIGHLVGRNIGILESKYRQLIAQACRDRGLTHLPTDKELEELYPIYCDKMLKFAGQAARGVIKDYIPIE